MLSHWNAHAWRICLASYLPFTIALPLGSIWFGAICCRGLLKSIRIDLGR